MKTGLFQLTYLICFFLFAVLGVMIFDDSSTFEMMSFTLWGCIIYIPISLLGCLVINNLSSKIVNPKSRLSIKALLSFFYLNTIFYIFCGGHFASEILLSVNAVHLISFAIASAVFWKEQGQQKYN